MRARPEARQQQQSLQVPIIDPHCGCFYICFTLFVSRSCTRFFSAGRRPSCLPACPVRPPDSSSLPVACCLATEINLKKPRALTDVRRGWRRPILVNSSMFFPLLPAASQLLLSLIASARFQPDLQTVEQSTLLLLLLGLPAAQGRKRRRDRLSIFIYCISLCAERMTEQSCAAIYNWSWKSR